MKNIPIIRKIYDFEFEVFKTHNESSVDFAACTSLKKVVT